MDVLYLVGDAFTERYPITADLAERDTRVVLTLTGEPPAITGGLTWPRADYVRCRDASLLIRPLREALEGAKRPLVIPREVRGPIGAVRVRLPERVRSHAQEVRWLSSLQELRHLPSTGITATPGRFGEDFSTEPTTGGYVTTTGNGGPEVILPVRCIAPTAPAELIPPEAQDGRIPIVFEALGGAREIGANCYYYSYGHRGLIVDVGFDATRDGWLGLPALERVPRLDAVVLTHAHLDHIGALPVLLAAFPNVPVYCTRATLAVLFPQLQDSAKVGQLRFGQTGEVPAVSRGLVHAIRPGQFRLLDYGIRTELPEIPGLTLEFQDAGHIIGSACVRLEFGGVSTLHTGDISVEDQHLLRGMRVNDLAADHLVMEGTYCAEPDFTREHRRTAVDGFLDAIAERLDAGGSILVPSFSLGRAQELVGMLVDWSDRTGRTVPIWTVGLVNALNEVSATLPEFLPGLSGTPFQRVRAFPQIIADTDAERRDAFARQFLAIAAEAPSIVIASHGMMTENTGSYLIGRAILTAGDTRHAIFLCGYMDPRTPGFRLRYQSEAHVIDYGAGDPVTRRIPPERIQFHRLTAHASYEELVEVAFRVPKQSVMLIHGDGEGLDGLKGDLLERFRQIGRTVTVRAPAIGERVMIEEVPPPVDWWAEVGERAVTEHLDVGRKFIRRSGLSVRGLTPDGRWALIPVGRQAASLALEHDGIEASRIERLEIRPQRGRPVVLFDRAQHLGDLGRIDWPDPGKVTWLVTARDPNAQVITAEFHMFYGAETRLMRTALNAAEPVLEVEVGGALEPEFISATGGRAGRRLDIRSVEWDAGARLLRIRLPGPREIGSVEDVHLSVLWPNGFQQEGPSLGSFTLEPLVEFRPAPARVGSAGSAYLSSTPRAYSARVGGETATLEDESIRFIPKRPGALAVELEYRTSAGDREWREVGILTVQPAARVDLPAETDVERGVALVVRDVNPSLHGVALALRVGGEVRDSWVAGGDPHTWSGGIDEGDSLEVAVVAPEETLILWNGTLRIYGGLRLDIGRSLTVTSSDGSLEAELAWIAPRRWNRQLVEEALAGAGFTVSGWSGDTLRMHGTPSTLGTRDVIIADGPRTIKIRIITLPDLRLALRPSGPFDVGDGGSLCTAGGEVSVGLAIMDGGPLTIEADRVSPLLDGLSVRMTGNRVYFLHPGRYSVALVASGRRLGQVIAEVRSPTKIEMPQATSRMEFNATSAYEASLRAAECRPCRTIAVLWPAGGSYRVLQDSSSGMEEVIWDFLCTRIEAEEKILVTWPGLSLGETAGRLLRRLRQSRPGAKVAHLSYPAPRGEIAVDEGHARNLRLHRVLCCAPAFSTVDRSDAYTCLQCAGRPRLRTDDRQIWLECPDCGYMDRDLVLTLTGLRSTDVRVLFAEYRMARYLGRGTGTRYAGAFGRSVRCTSCHQLQPAFARPSPWERTELNRILVAMSSVWDPTDEIGSVRRAARLAARRTPRSRPTDLARIEDALRRLIDAGIVQAGRAVGQLQRLESGMSLCCGKPLMWSRHRISHLFIDVEDLLSPVCPSPTHPDLSPGQLGVRQFLALAE